MALLSTQNPEIGEYIAKLENNINLAQEEMDKIINAVENYL
jgi:CHASE3 domain sensor protein